MHSKKNRFLALIIIFFTCCLFAEKFSITNHELHDLFDNKNNIKKALFTSKNNLTQIIIDLIKNEKKSIKAAIYIITDRQIANALIEAKKRGINVEIITCRSNLNNIINQFVEHDIKVYSYGFPTTKKGMSNPLMHNKFFIFEQNINDKSVLWTGSFNMTYSAQSKNKENVLLIEDKMLIEQYLEEYETIKKQSRSLIRICKKRKFEQKEFKMPLIEKFKKSFRILT